MVFHKLFCVMFLLFISTVLASCGGGGSSGVGDVGQVPFSLDTKPDGAGSKYQGKTNATKLTPDNSLAFLESLYGITSNSDSGLSKVTSFSKVRYSQKGVIALNRAVNEERNGIVSGTYKISGDINDKGLGVLVAEWNDFSDVQGEIIHGKSILNVIEYDIFNDVITKSTTKMVDLESTEKGRTIVSNGYVVEVVDLSGNKATSIFDMAFYDKNQSCGKLLIN